MKKVIKTQKKPIINNEQVTKISSRSGTSGRRDLDALNEKKVFEIKTMTH
jgi:hypothetical protein